MNAVDLDSKSQERRSARFWSSFVLALMAINLLIALVAIVVAVRDPSFQPVPSYGENGVDWETRKQLQTNSDSLGWTADVERGSDRNEVRLVLTDSRNHPVTGASGTVQVYHFTRAGQPVTAPLLESTDRPGMYYAAIDVARDGRWHVTAKLSRAPQEQFLWDHDVEWYR
ncbi:MAG: FixH family protein [Planctomycetota bacterium]|jgi:nitrogen fixation protein FixH